MVTPDEGDAPRPPPPDQAASISGAGETHGGHAQDRTGRFRVCCPHCYERVPLADGETGHDITCPSCGNRFNCTGDLPTATRRPTPQQVGRFQLLEELGAGQFGVVWKALDTRLDRIVALKIPRRGRVEGADADTLLREARAAAQLSHPHIVSVHEVGRHEDLIFIASDFVQGADLKQWLAARRPTFRQVAEFGATVAEALEHAHQAGVVHRDLKPGNIMVDVAGQPHIMDFGLAKRDTGEVTVTLDGQVLGTPAYMSPEQAMGAAHRADRRSDVYSLGVILYEMLTGELPFRGERQMLILQILSDEPLWPRRLNARIPRDLETICLKCLEKKPDHRYATAAAVAADLRAWLDNRPIEARPVGRLVRAGRWCQRRPAVAALLALVVLVTAIGFAGVTWQWSRARARYVESERQRNRADQYLGKLLDAVDRMLVEVGAERLREEPHLEATRRKLLEEALAFYDWLASQEVQQAAPGGTEPGLADVQHYQALALARIGELRFWLGEIGAAVYALEQSNRLLEDLPPISSKKHEIEATLAHNYFVLAKIDGEQRESEAALQHVGIAIEMCQQIIGDSDSADDARLLLAQSVVLRGRFYRNVSKLDKAEACFVRAIDELDHVKDIALKVAVQTEQTRAHYNLGNLLSDTPRIQEAEESYQKALETGEMIAEQGSEGVRLLASVLSDMAIFLSAIDRHADADKARERAIAMRQRLVADFPSVPTYRDDLAQALASRGWSHFQQQQLNQAAVDLEGAVSILEVLTRDFPAIVVYSDRLANTCNLLGIVRHTEKKPDEAQRAYERARAAWEAGLAREPKNAKRHHDLGGLLANQSVMLMNQSHCTDALILVDQAMDHERQALAIEPRNVEMLRYYLNQHLTKARLHKRLDQYAPMIAAYEGTVRLSRELQSLVPTASNKQQQSQILQESAFAILNVRELSQDEYQRARNRVDLAIALTGDSQRLQTLIAMADYRLGDWQRAADLLRGIPEKDHEAYLLAYLSMSLTRLGDRQGAQTALDAGRALLSRYSGNTLDTATDLLNEADRLLQGP